MQPSDPRKGGDGRESVGAGANSGVLQDFPALTLGRRVVARANAAFGHLAASTHLPSQRSAMASPRATSSAIQRPAVSAAA